MASGMRQVMRQGQQLVMTQQLQQAIKLLQLSNLELSHYVDQQLEINPLLERDTGPADDHGPREDNRQENGSGETASRTLATSDRALQSGHGDTESGGPLDTRYDNMFSNDDRDLSAARGEEQRRSDESMPVTSDPWRSARGGGSFDGTFTDDGSARLSDAPSLRDMLHEQLALSSEDVGEEMIGRYLIDTVDDSGYLLDDLADIAGRLGCSVGEAETVLTKLQHFEPAGVFARNLSECLALQLREKDRLDPAMQVLVENLEALGDGRLDWLRRQCGVDEEDFADMLAEIRALDPKPGLSFESDPAEFVVPDVFVSQTEDGWTVELNQDVLPRVLLNRQYYAEVKKAARGKGDKAYLSDCFSTGSWLVKALDQRATTILKVSQEIVRQQQAFFIHGVSGLRPLNLRTIAEAIGMHESTISRVTANKYLSCTRGTFELKYFFTAAIASSDGGDAHSAESVRQRIRNLIDAEDPKHILSDDKIVTLLKADKVDIARRTVAKYREAMHIPSSVQRRRQKAAR